MGDNEDWTGIASEMIANQSKLEFVGIRTDASNFVHIAKGLEAGFYASPHITTDITLHLSFSYGILEPRKAYVYLAKLLVFISQTKRRNFLIVCAFEGETVENCVDWTEEFHRFAEYCKDDFLIRLSQGRIY